MRKILSHLKSFASYYEIMGYLQFKHPKEGLLPDEIYETTGAELDPNHQLSIYSFPQTEKKPTKAISDTEHYKRIQMLNRSAIYSMRNRGRSQKNE